MNYLESHAGDVIDKDVKFVYSPSNREESFKLILSDEKFIYLSCYPVFKTTVLKYCNVLTSLVDFDKGNPLRTWKPMAGDCPIQHKQLNIPEDLPDELLARCAESAADAGNSSSTGNRTPGSSSNMSSPALSPRKRISDSSLSPGGLSPTKKVYSHQFPKKRKREVTSQLLPQQVKRLKSMPPSPSKRVLEEGEVEKTLSDISDAELETGGTGSLTPAVSLDNVSDTSFEGRSLSLVDKPVNDPLLELLEDVTNDTSTNENNTYENDLETSHDTSIFDIETVTDKTDNGSKDTLQTADFAEKEDDSKDNSTEKTDNGSKDTLQTADFAEKEDDSKDDSDSEINKATSIPTNDDNTPQAPNTNLLEVDKENIVNEKSLGESEECSNENLLKSAKLKPCRITLTPLPASACKNSDTDSSSDEASDKQSNEPSKNRNQDRPKPFETQKSHDSYFNDKRKELPKTLQSQKSHEPNIGKENKGHQSNNGSSQQKRPSFHRQQSKILPSKPVIQTQKSIDIKSQSKAPTDYLSHILNTSNINQPIKPGEKGVSNESSKNRNNPLTNTSKKSTSSTKKSPNNDSTKNDKDLEDKCGKPNKNPPSCLDNEEMIDLAYDDIERLQDIPGVNEEQAQKIIDYRERKSIKDFFDFSTRLFFLKLFVNIIQFDVGALRRGNLILAFNGKRLDTTSMDETLRCFKLAAPDIENIAVPQIIVIAGCTSNSDIKDEFRRARRKTGVKWVQLVEQWIKQSGVDKSEFFKMKSEIKKNKSKEKNRRSSRTEESLIPRTSSPDRNSRDRAPADKNDKKKEEGLDAISDFINSTEHLPKEDNESNKENLQKSSNQKDNTKKSTNKNDENEKFSKDNSNDKVSADLRDYIGEDAPVINLNNRITLERKTESSDSSESDNDDLNEDTTEKVNELVEKKGRATPNSVILSMTSTKSSSYNRMESVSENVQEESNSCSLKIRLKIPQNVRPERKRKRSGRSSLRKRNSSGQTVEASDRESVESNVQRHTRAASKRLRTVSTSDHSPTTPREDTPDNNTSTQDIPDVPLQENADSDHLTDNNTENNNEEAPAQTSSQKSDDDIRSISLEEKCKLWLKDSATFFSRPSQCRYSVKIQLSRILLEGSSGNQNSKTERQNTWSLEPITEEQENVDSDDCWFHFPDKKDAERYVGPVFSPLNWNYCSLCNKEYTDMSKHVQLVHSTETGAKNEEQRRHLTGTEKRRENGAPTPSQHVYICKKCELNFRTLDKLNSHIIKKH